jgi:hypothetical protein
MSRGDTTLVEYLSDIAVIVFVEPQECAEVWRGLVTAGRSDVVHPDRLEEVLALFPRLHVASLPVRTPDVDVGARHQPAFNGSVQMLVRDLRTPGRRYHTLVTFPRPNGTVTRHGNAALDDVSAPIRRAEYRRTAA